MHGMYVYHWKPSNEMSVILHGIGIHDETAIVTILIYFPMQFTLPELRSINSDMYKTGRTHLHYNIIMLLILLQIKHQMLDQILP